MQRPTIALLTDFGLADPYVGILKAVILGMAPRAQIVDLSHAIAPGDVPAAALGLWQAAPFLGSGSVLVAVVDPGVGSERRPLAVSIGAIHAIGPDNGVLSWLLRSRTPWKAALIDLARLDIAWQPSSTFHGRDLFAPAAARLAQGWTLEQLGPPVTDPILLDPPRLSIDRTARTISGSIVHFDSFGNAITSIGRLTRKADSLQLEPWLGQMEAIELPAGDLQARLTTGLELPVVTTYADVPAGAPLAYIGSSGLLEIGVHRGRADEVLGLRLDDRLHLCYKV